MRKASLLSFLQAQREHSSVPATRHAASASARNLTRRRLQLARWVELFVLLLPPERLGKFLLARSHEGTFRATGRSATEVLQLRVERGGVVAESSGARLLLGGSTHRLGRQSRRLLHARPLLNPCPFAHLRGECRRLGTSGIIARRSGPERRGRTRRVGASAPERVRLGRKDPVVEGEEVARREEKVVVLERLAEDERFHRVFLPGRRLADVLDRGAAERKEVSKSYFLASQLEFVDLQASLGDGMLDPVDKHGPALILPLAVAGQAPHVKDGFDRFGPADLTPVGGPHSWWLTAGSESSGKGSVN